MIKIKVTYDPRGEEPCIEIEPKGAEYEVEYEPGDFLFEHKGVRVYSTAWKGCYTSEYWYSTYSGHESDSDDAFDVRDIPGDIPCDREENHHKIIKHAIDQGWLTEDGLELPEEEVGQ